MREALRRSSNSFSEGLTQQGRDDILEVLLICGIDLGANF